MEKCVECKILLNKVSYVLNTVNGLVCDKCVFSDNVSPPPFVIDSMVPVNSLMGRELIK